MKRNQLHNFIEAFETELPRHAQHQAKVRLVLTQARPAEKSIDARIRGALQTKGEFLMHTNIKRFAAPSIIAAAFIVTASVVTIRQVPYAQAESVASNGLQSLESMSPAEKAALALKFGGMDPRAGIQAAKDASDLRTISKEEYQKLVREARSAVTIDQSEVDAGSNTSTNTTEPSTTQVPDSAGVKTNPGSKDGAELVELQAQLDNDVARAAKFVRYTSGPNKTVVVAFDANDAPLFRTVIVL